MRAFILVKDKCVECGKFFIGINMPCGDHVCAYDADTHGARCARYQDQHSTEQK